MRQRTEPSSSKDPSQFSRPLERSKLDKEEKTAKVNQRNQLSAKPTMPKVDSVLEKTALLSQHALHHSALDLDQDLVQYKTPQLLVVLDSTPNE